ncbi:MAG TPA: cytochrome c oxidase assembly protein [Gaiellales bacterium]|nr:cytochrome c oxidase assembly protein [Gaiellales bacterium]
MSDAAWSWLEVAGALLPVVAYLAVMQRARRTGGGWPAWRAGAFTAAVGLWAVVTCTAFDDQARRSLTWHMCQQMTLLLFVPPLLLAGRPLALMRRLTGARRATWVPGAIVAWVTFVGIQWVIHVPAVLDWAVGPRLAEGLMHLLLLAAGLLFFAAVMTPGHRIEHPFAATLYLAAAMPTTDAIALWLILDPRVIYSGFAGPHALADQQAAGVIMFAAGNVLLAAAAVVAGRYLWDGRPTAQAVPR